MADDSGLEGKGKRKRHSGLLTDELQAMRERSMSVQVSCQLAEGDVSELIFSCQLNAFCGASAGVCFWAWQLCSFSRQAGTLRHCTTSLRSIRQHPCLGQQGP
jgi:hypothetical protein